MDSRDYNELYEHRNIDNPRKPSPFAQSPYVSYYQEDAPQAPEKPSREKKTKAGWGRRIVSAILVIVLVVSACGVTAALVTHHWEQKKAVSDKVFENRLNILQQQIDAMDVQGGGSSTAPSTGMTPGQVYAKNVRAVVAISNQSITTNIYGQVSETASSGSGFIISPDGYVVSNYHVVQGARKLHVLTYDGHQYEAELVGYDATNDVSLLKIDAEDLPCVTLGSSDDLAVGDQVAAIGNPLGELTSTLTVGYISAKDRMVTTDGVTINMLQTDAAINSGNSGGPLFNMDGQVVGITTAKYSGNSTSGATIEGIGFAIPIDDITGAIEDLREFGYVTSAYLGVMVKDVDEVAQSYGLPAGAYVSEVTAGTAAERAGLQAKDIIINLGGHNVSSVADLTRALRKFEAGQTETITVYRSGQHVDLTITFDALPAPEEEQPTEPTQEIYEDPYDEYFDWDDIFGFFPFF